MRKVLKKKRIKRVIILVSMLVIVFALGITYIRLAYLDKGMVETTNKDLISDVDYKKLNCEDMPKLEDYKTIEKTLCYDCGYFTGFYISFETTQTVSQGEKYKQKVFEYFCDNYEDYGYLSNTIIRYFKKCDKRNELNGRNDMMVKTNTNKPLTTEPYYLYFYFNINDKGIGIMELYLMLP